ncbi:thymic stromal lymphopoietin [Odocoileus virginianus]|uniref:Thymic stromal lymphopoietin n=1 Tax=Odocoileus virginianus TaxID=9874 RepID=A0ABM4HT86_ODOVR
MRGSGACFHSGCYLFRKIFILQLVGFVLTYNFTDCDFKKIKESYRNIIYQELNNYTKGTRAVDFDHIVYCEDQVRQRLKLRAAGTPGAPRRRGPCGARSAGGGRVPRRHWTPGAAPPAARGRRARDGPGVPSGPLGRTPLRQRRPVSAAPPAAGRANPPSAPRHPEGLRPALKKRVRDGPGADVRASPGLGQGRRRGRADRPPERPRDPGPRLRRSARPRPSSSARSLSPPPHSLRLSPSHSLPPLPPSLARPLPAFSPRVTRAACAQPDCLSKIQNLTFEWRPGCAALAREAFAVQTRATLAAACQGYRGAQVNNTQTMKKIRKRQIKTNECLEQVISLKQLWQRLSRIS